MILSSSVGVGGGVSIEIVIVISSIVPTVVIVGVRVIGLWGATLFSMVFVLSTPGMFGSSTSFGGLFGFSGVAGLFFLSWSHKGFNMQHCCGW